jgi:hypothetical protein
MRSLVIAVSALFILAAPMSAPVLAADAPAKGAVNVAVLRRMVDNAGYKTTPLADTSKGDGFEFTTNRDGVDIYVLGELSPNERYIWFKVAMGKPPADRNDLAFLNANRDIQPAQFYLYEDGDLGMAVSMDNRAVNEGDVTKVIDILLDGVAGTTDVWQGD